jgi:hypothetical protein
MKKGRKGVWKGRVIKDDLNLCPDYGPYEHIYGKFDMSDDEKVTKKIEKQFAVLNGHLFLFKSLAHLPLLRNHLNLCIKHAFIAPISIPHPSFYFPVFFFSFS